MTIFLVREQPSGLLRVRIALPPSRLLRRRSVEATFGHGEVIIRGISWDDLLGTLPKSERTMLAAVHHAVSLITGGGTTHRGLELIATGAVRALLGALNDQVMVEQVLEQLSGSGQK